MQYRSFMELATDDRFPGACEIRSVYACPYESHDDLGRNKIGHVVTSAFFLSPSSVRPDVRFLENREFRRNR